MKTWTRMPVFRIFIPFAAGILIGFEEIISLHRIVLPFALASLISLLFTLKRFASGRHATRWLAGIPWTFTWLTGGILTSTLFISGEPDNRDYAADSVIAVVDDYPRWGNQSVKFPARVIATALDTHTRAADFTVMVSSRNGNQQELMPGDLIVLPGRLRPVNTTGLPGTFDYKAYLLKKGIRCRIIADGEEIRLLKRGYDVPARHFASGERSALAELLKTYLPDSATLGITCALVLGDERWLEDTVESGYAGAGVLHVLCVSGMHVVLLLSVAEKLISLIRLRPGIRRFRYPVLILLTWYYTSLTGFTPSIVRAAMMMTLVLTGKMLQRPGNMPNMLASCVLLLVIFDPSYLVNAGFQLSFLAVAGIVFIHERLRWALEPSTKAGKWIWDMISVSLAAQLATFPLSMYYFHQFPNYFLLANLIIVPVSTLVLYLGMVLVMVSWIPQVVQLLAFLITKTVYFLNGTALWISSLPYSISGDLFITIAELILLSALIFSGFLIGRGAAKTRVITLLILANGLVMCRIIQEVSNSNIGSIMVTGYPAPGGMGVISGRSGLVIAPEHGATDPAAGIATYMKSRFTDQITTITIKEKQYVRWEKGGERCLYLSVLNLRAAENLIHKEKPTYLIAGSYRGKKHETAVNALCDSAGIRHIHLKAEGSQLWDINP